MEWFLKEEGGQGLAEYAFLLGAIALLAVGAVSLYADKVVAMYQYIISQI